MLDNLIIQSANSEGEVVDIASFREGLISVGRGDENGLIINEGSVSRQHGFFLKAGTQWIYYDNNSTNGSWVNSSRVFKDRICLLRYGDIVQLSDKVLKILSDKDDLSLDIYPSILVFFDNRFLFEVDFRGEVDEFYLCLDNGQCNISKVQDDTSVANFIISNKEIKFTPLEGSINPTINEIPSINSSIVKDRDQVSLSDFLIVVNDPHSSTKNDTEINHVTIKSVSDSSESIAIDANITNVDEPKVPTDKKNFGWDEDHSDTLPIDRSKIIVDHKNVYDTYSFSKSDIEFNVGDTINNLGKSLRYASAEAIAEEKNEDYTIDPLSLIWFIVFIVLMLLILLYSFV